MVAPTYAWTVIALTAVDADSPLDETLMTALVKNQIHLEEWLGDGYTAAKDHDHDDTNSKAVSTIADGAVSTEAKLASSVVAQAKLKTADSSGSATGIGNMAMSGGRYSFYPQTKSNGATNGAIYTGYTSTFQTLIAKTDASNTFYWQNRYISASGKDHWIFILRDKIIKEIMGTWEAPDHPCYGQGGDENDIPHPFVSYFENPLPANLEIILIHNSIVDELKGKRTSFNSISEIIIDEYDVDELSSPTYKSREIIEIDEYDDKQGTVIADLGNGKKLKKRMVTSLPSIITYKDLKLK